MTATPTLEHLLATHADQLARARELTKGIASFPQERRRIVQQLAGEGIPMAAIARELGICRQRLYEIVKGA